MSVCFFLTLKSPKQLPVSINTKWSSYTEPLKKFLITLALATRYSQYYDYYYCYTFQYNSPGLVAYLQHHYAWHNLKANCLRKITIFQ